MSIAAVGPKATIKPQATATTEASGGDSEQYSGGSGLKPGWGVSPERQQVIESTLRGLAPRAGRLAPAQLRSITMALAARHDLWADLVVHDPDVRWYLPLHRSNSCDVWLLAWEARPRHRLARSWWFDGFVRHR